MSIAFTTQPQSGSYRQGATPVALTAIAAASEGHVDYKWFYSSDGTSFSPCISGLFDLTDGTNVLIDDLGDPIEGYNETFADSSDYTPSTATVGVIYYYCQARKTATGETDEFATSNTVTITITQATVPIITAFSYSKNPCNTGEAILVTATVTEG